MSGPGVRVSVRLTPRGGRDAIDGVGAAGELRCRVAAAPVDGGANRSLVRLLADALGVPPSNVAIETGTTARLKRVAIEGSSAEQIAERWPGIRIG